MIAASRLAACLAAGCICLLPAVVVGAAPEGDPGAITKDDYIKVLDPYRAKMEATYARGDKPSPYSYEAVAVFAAYWKATHDPRYVKLALNAVNAYGLAEDAEITRTNDEMAKKKSARPTGNVYWTWYYMYLVVPVLEMKGAPGYEELAQRLGEILQKRSLAWPVYWEIGAQNRSFYPAFTYDAAHYFLPREKQPDEMRSFADAAWKSWWTPRDIEEDDPHYAALDLITLDGWSRLRGESWWQDEKAAALWRSYAEQVSNDGTWPPYADGGVYGDYFTGMIIAEMTASRLGDGKYKWLAHRAFWNGRGRLEDLIKGVGNGKVADLALAYLYADDTIKERAPEAGVTVTKRSFRERTDWSKLKDGSPLFVLHEERAPSKLLFRGGAGEKDQFLMVQAGSAAGHAHPDTGSILFYGGDFSYFLSHGISRLDYAMQQHNMFVLEDPSAKGPWKQGDYAVESTAVAVSGTAPGASYARLEIAEYPGTETTASAWNEVKTWDGKGYPQRHAVGYRNWPVRLERRVLFVHDQFVVVRDVVRFLQPVTARVGQNWVVGAIGGARGGNWIDVATPTVYGYPFSDPPKAPVSLGDDGLLIWFAPFAGGATNAIEGPKHSTYNNNFINLPNRAWYPRLGNWEAGKSLAFTTVLVAHRPDENVKEIAAGISVAEDDSDATVLRIKMRGREYLVAMNAPGHEVSSSSF
ncbi:MAG TPA: hypothetical protein VGI57_16165, partial [Usitatibacter sp.]